MESKDKPGVHVSASSAHNTVLQGRRSKANEPADCGPSMRLVSAADLVAANDQAKAAALAEFLHVDNARITWRKSPLSTTPRHNAPPRLNASPPPTTRDNRQQQQR